MDDNLADAVHGLRCWRNAGEQAANRGIDCLMRLDVYVDIALDELEHRRDPERARHEEIERPSHDQLQWALSGIADNFADKLLGSDLKIVHAALTPSSEPTP